MKRRMLIGSGVALAAVGAGVGWGLSRSRRGLDDAESAFWQLSFEQPGGGTLAMASLRGAPVLLNFWATWCAPCLKEMPLLDRFYRDRQASGWKVIGLAVDEGPAVRDYLARVPVSFPIGLAGMGGVDVSLQLGNTNAALPFSVVFDKQGMVLARKLGTVSEAELQRWDKQLSAA